MKKILIVMLVATAAAGAYARPHGGHGFGHRPPPMHHHHSFWGHGGSHFWPGFVGGVVGGALASRTVVTPAPVVVAPSPVVVTPAPVVVTQPTVVTQPVVAQPVVAAPVTQVQNVWVEGQYVDQVQANGTVVRVWSPGHYEQRTVVVQ